jgi:redox-sensitive bicupin YhaK (pirin superfamily)
MRMEIRRASTRGAVDFGWLQSNHSFSFGGWYDPRYMGFGHLRVINDDVVQAGMGFGTHPHRNMEIVSYVTQGALAHEDTLGNGGVIRPGEIQVMSAGRGIAHSEHNGSDTEEVRFLQIWLLPREGNTAPGWTQRAFERVHGATLLTSPDARDGSLPIGQDVDLWRFLLPDGGTAAHPVARDRVWVQLVKGGLEVDGALLQPGDGLAIDAAHGARLRLKAVGAVEALLFDLQ